jgi:hypothetical protein
MLVSLSGNIKLVIVVVMLGISMPMQLISGREIVYNGSGKEEDR